MNTNADKTQESKSQSAANPISQNQSIGEQTFQLADNRPEAVMQRKLHEMANISWHQKEAAQLQAIANSQTSQLDAPLQKKATSESAPKANNTGLPNNLKTGIENLSGYSMDDVKVHRNSDKPAQLQAHAYAQGTDIHLGPGQEKHLPHEAWHVVQQKQGRVKPTLQMKGKVNVNDDKGLEKEADVMGGKALHPHFALKSNDTIRQTKAVITGTAVQQRMAQEVSSMVFQVENLFKRAKTLLITSIADDLEDDKTASYQTIITHAEAELHKYVSSDSIVLDDTPQINPMFSNESIFVSNGIMKVTSEYLEMDNKAVQARMLFDILTQDRVVGDDLMAFMDKSNYEFDDKENISLSAGVSLFRVLNAASAYKYIANGISRVGNREGWTELGKGFYTSPDFKGAEIYAPTVGRPAAIIELKLEDEASGKVFKDTGDVDGKTEAAIESEFGVEHFVTDQDVSQIKFHNPFYRESFSIHKVSVLESEDNWRKYTTQEFTDSYRQHIIERHKSKAAEVDEKPQNPDAPMSIDELDDVSNALRSAPDASKQIVDAIEYSEAAINFETKLGNYLATYGPALNQVSALVTAAWNRVEAKSKSKFGTKQSINTGMVGDDLISLQAVVSAGNLREKFTFLYNGYQNNIFGKLDRPEELTQGRASREPRPQEDSDAVIKPHPGELDLPLSDREWFGAVDGHGNLGWQSGASKYHHKMDSEFQADAELLLAPVGSGMSGTAYGILQMSQILAENIEVDYKLVRLGLLGWMIPAKDHTFHEIMTACKIFSEGELPYDPELYRYQNIEPLDTAFLRDNIATDNLFPDEISHEKNALGMLLQSAQFLLQDKLEPSLNLNDSAVSEFPKRLWTQRMNTACSLLETIDRYKKTENKHIKSKIYMNIQNDFEDLGVDL